MDTDWLDLEPGRTTPLPQHECAAAENHKTPEGKNSDREGISQACDPDVTCCLLEAGFRTRGIAPH